MNIASKIIVDELIESSHIQPVEDVIFWALCDYAKNNSGLASGVVAYAVKERIIEAKKEKVPIIQNFELVNSLNL